MFSSNEVYILSTSQNENIFQNWNSCTSLINILHRENKDTKHVKSKLSNFFSRLAVSVCIM